MTVPAGVRDDGRGQPVHGLDQAARTSRRIFARMHLPERLGMGVERVPRRLPLAVRRRAIDRCATAASRGVLTVKAPTSRVCATSHLN